MGMNTLNGSGTDRLIRNLHKPCDPSLLAFLRICFGLLMMIDIPQERGMAHADSKYGDDAKYSCRFPLIHGMKPFSRDDMILLYAMMFINAFFVMVGFFYRVNILLFTCIYWYIFVLDTSSWNNHSYLYGLLAFLLLFTNANNYLSIDGILNKNHRNSDVSKWNYTLLRFQVFVVYFYAGLKKTELDWLTGYSMHKLSKQWIFSPLRLVLSEENIDFWLIHICGFIYDTSVGFLLYFDASRIIGLLLSAMFHGMNSAMFNIGMFPYMMFAASFIFCDPKSFKDFLARLPVIPDLIDTGKSSQNSSCLYITKKNSNYKRNWKQVCVLSFTLFYILSQGILPYSHFITKGYNGWTEGLYGYSWDMMVHSFKNQHIKITYRNPDTGETGYLKPGAFLNGRRSRWSTQPAMAVQYARCIKEQLENLGIKDAAVYFDVWKSMNGRFQQRIFNPHVDLAHYAWSPTRSPEFVMPLLRELSDWRMKLREIKKKLRNITSAYNVVFVADFPGMYLENFVQEGFDDTTIEVLNGEVVVETDGEKNTTLKAGGKIQVDAAKFHKVYAISPGPSSYAYIYINTTAEEIRERLIEFEKNLDDDQDMDQELDPGIAEMYWREQRYKEFKQNRTAWESFGRFCLKRLSLFRRSFLLAYFSSRNLIAGRPPPEIADKELDILNSWDFPSMRQFSSSMTVATSQREGKDRSARDEL